MTGSTRVAAPWRPGSWRDHPIEQCPGWSGPDVERATGELRRQPALVSPAETAALRDRLAAATGGDGLVLQFGDCVESFATAPDESVRQILRLTAALVTEASAAGLTPVPIARIAGQYAKPRSAPRDPDTGLPAFRGEAVNGPEATARSRRPEPARMVAAYHRAAATMERLRRTGRPLAVSHEALLLPYEEALTRRDPGTGGWYAGSTHLPWIGDRTRAPEGAHVCFASGVGNPVGVKLGPSASRDDVLALCARLDPERRPARLALICRFGADRVAELLPGVLRAVAGAGHRPLWMCDPMHGNTVRRAGNRKTRHLDRILAEQTAFVRGCRRLGAIPGGLHLEATAAPVAECLGGDPPVTEDHLAAGFRSLCDPRLNEAQSVLAVRRFAADVRAG